MARQRSGLVSELVVREDKADSAKKNKKEKNEKKDRSQNEEVRKRKKDNGGKQVVGAMRSAVCLGMARHGSQAMFGSGSLWAQSLKRGR